MSTKANFKDSEIGLKNPFFSKSRVTIETAFYGNNVVKIESLKEAYKLARSSPGTIVTDMEVYRAEELGLKQGTKVLLFNDGEVTGRCAAARRIASETGVNVNAINDILRDAIYDTRVKKMYHAEAYVGLHEDFMVKAHLLVPEGEENTIYSWLLNFQYTSEKYIKMYKKSEKIKDEVDIYVFSDAQWKDENYPLGLTFFDPDTNCSALLGMRYFGEFKKATLTLAWTIANRNGYASCHGGQKRYNLADGNKFVAGVFGLSGSGKSTITHAAHGGKYDITVLHDDAFIISMEDGSSIALEPSYFDKTQDYPTGNPDNKYLITVQNCGATVDENDKIVLVTEDIRNGNGRAIKSKLWSPNRVDKLEEPINAIFWLMKDPTLPPVIKLNGSSLASVMGATLATKRTTAERIAKDVDINALVVEPYANPFRTYPLINDYEKFKDLVEKRNVDCYILNTGEFMGKKVQPSDTLGILEDIVEGKAVFKKWNNFSDIKIYEWEGFIPDMNDLEYIRQLRDRMNERVDFIKSRDNYNGGFDKLPSDAINALEKVIAEL